MELAEDIDVSKMKKESESEITKVQLDRLKNDIDEHNIKLNEEECEKIFDSKNLTIAEYRDLKEKGSNKRSHDDDMALIKYELAETLFASPASPLLTSASMFKDKEELSKAREFIEKIGKKQIENFKMLPFYIENQTKLQVELYNLYDHRNDQKYDTEERILQLLNKGNPLIDRAVSINIIWTFFTRLGYDSIQDLFSKGDRKFTAQQLLDTFTNFSEEILELGDFKVSMKSKILDMHRAKLPSKIQEVRKYLNNLISGIFPFKFYSNNGRIKTERQIITLQVAQWKKDN